MFIAFGHQLGDEFVGKQRKIQNGGVVKFDVFQTRKYARIKIHEYRDSAEAKFEQHDNLIADIIAVDKLSPLRMKLQFVDVGTSPSWVHFDNVKFDFIAMPYEILDNSVVSVIRGFSGE